MAAGGAPDGTVVWALEQTAGKGRRGGTWESPPGNLYFSVLLRVKSSPNFTFIAAVALAEALDEVVENVACKWPNDILVNGRKAAGVLLEADGDLLVVGVGVNIASHPSGVSFPATCLKAEAAFEAEDVAPEALLKGFLARFQAWRERDFADVRAAWLKRAHGLGAPIVARLARETVSGIFHGLGEDGALILLQDGQERRIMAADVFFE